MVWYMELSPSDSLPPSGSPRKAAKEPPCACRLETIGVGVLSRVIQGGKFPVSKPPLTRMQAPGVGVGVSVGVGVGVGVAVGVGGGVPVAVGVGVPLPTGPWIPTVIGAPVLKKPIVAFAAWGGLLESKRKLYNVPQRIAFAFWFCAKVSELQLRSLAV